MKKLIATILNFTTGLGFYGLGLLIAGILIIKLFPGNFFLAIGSGFIGAFVFKNWQSIVKYFNKGKDKILG